MSSVIKVLKGIYQPEFARRRPIGVTARLLAWQFWRHAFRRPMQFETVTGTKLLLVPGASSSLSGFWYHRMPDFEELAFVLHLLRPGELFVDVGANQGGWSLTVAGRGARVMAFEPVPVTRNRLVANVAINPQSVQDRISVLRFGLGDGDRQVTFTADHDAGNHELGDGEAQNGGTVTVDLRTADRLLAAERPVAIKIDVEGGELGVLRGGRAILGKPSLRAVVMETFRPLNYAEPSLVASEAILREHGFLPMAYEPWKRELRHLHEPSDGAQNTIYVREPTQLVPILKQAMAVRTPGKNV